MKRARATKKEIQQRRVAVRQWVRKNPGGKVNLIAQATKLPVEITRQTLLKLCGEPTKRGFKMYRKDNRFYTYRPTGKQTTPTTEVSDKGNAGFSKAQVFTATVQDVKDAGSFKPSDVKRHMDKKKVSFAQQAARLQILHTTVGGFLNGQLSLNALRQAHDRCIVEGEE